MTVKFEIFGSLRASKGSERAEKRRAGGNLCGERETYSRVIIPGANVPPVDAGEAVFDASINREARFR